MTRHRVDDRAQDIYDFLYENTDQVFRIAEVCDAIGVENTATTRAAFRVAARLAAADGVCLTVPCPDNEFYCAVTADPNLIITPMLFLARVEHGVYKRKRLHEDVVKRRIASVDAKDRPAVRKFIKIQSAMADIQEAVIDLTDEMVKIRRDQRRGE